MSGFCGSCFASLKTAPMIGQSGLPDLGYLVMSHDPGGTQGTTRGYHQYRCVEETEPFIAPRLENYHSTC
jgi:hypothetical protein